MKFPLFRGVCWELVRPSGYWVGAGSTARVHRRDFAGGTEAIPLPGAIQI